MADEKEDKNKKKEEAPLKTSKDASVDWSVEVVSQDGDKYHENDVKFDVGHKKAIELVKLGRVSLSPKGKKQLEELEEGGVVTKAQLKGILSAIALVFLMLFGAPKVDAQVSILQDLKSVYSSTSDTLTNAATTYLTTLSRLNGDHSTTTVQVIVDELSGTTAGTVILQGSLDGSNFFTLTDSTTVPEITTWTLADQAAAQTKAWVINKSPYLYYRVSHSGGTTMSAIITAKVMAH